ncbi:iron chelate uptake ABC transporter family permease subunit [Snodgrassella sp. CFCC 13594]|uniref:iron chelate uptake ABC transporter family permease subunit n=1 Tax=Snodgrassella sp. CFCC 13594 TaxID=1775559 RepID=UPI0008304A75|nr:iron chelate uptake ABC transporter family permease subunit [Snodgrassella sp. CFCC 13594]
MLPDALRRPAVFLGLLGLLLAASCLCFMTFNAQGQWDFVLALRGKKLLMLLTVAYAVGVSTLLFQTLTHNPVLTPSLLGYDALYLLMQTAMVWLVGAAGVQVLGVAGKFSVEAPLMMAASWLLFQTLMRHSNGDLARLILVGVIFGVLFRSLNSLLQRLIDPAQFATAQISYFAQFTSVEPTLLLMGMVIMAISAIWIWRMRYALDVLQLGRNAAISLGVNYARLSRAVLLWVALLVSVATALVGPVSFFGLLVCALVNALSPTQKHSIRLPAAGLMAAIILIIGQTLFEHVLGLSGALSVVIEFTGGLVFLWLVLRRPRR